jgi:hypothetical protein
MPGQDQQALVNRQVNETPNAATTSSTTSTLATSTPASSTTATDTKTSGSNAGASSANNSGASSANNSGASSANNSGNKTAEANTVKPNTASNIATNRDENRRVNNADRSNLPNSETPLEQLYNFAGDTGQGFYDFAKNIYYNLNPRETDPTKAYIDNVKYNSSGRSNEKREMAKTSKKKPIPFEYDIQKDIEERRKEAEIERKRVRNYYATGGERMNSLNRFTNYYQGGGDVNSPYASQKTGIYAAENELNNDLYGSGMMQDPTYDDNIYANANNMEIMPRIEVGDKLKNEDANAPLEANLPFYKTQVNLKKDRSGIWGDIADTAVPAFAAFNSWKNQRDNNQQKEKYLEPMMLPDSFMGSDDFESANEGA